MFERIGTSKSFWLGVAGIVVGGLGMFVPAVASTLQTLSMPDPGTLLSGGAVLVGLRDALAKLTDAAKS